MPRRRRLQRPARGRFKGGRAGGRGGRPRAALGSIQKLLPAAPRRRGAQGGGAAASARGAPEAEDGRPPGPALRQFGPPWPPQEARSATASRPPSAPDAPPRPGPGPRPPDGRARASRATAGRAAGPSTAGRSAWPRGRSCTARWPRAGAASSGRAPSGTDPRWTCSCPWASRGRARKCGLQPGSPPSASLRLVSPARPPASRVPWGSGAGARRALCGRGRGRRRGCPRARGGGESLVLAQRPPPPRGAAGISRAPRGPQRRGPWRVRPLGTGAPGWPGPRWRGDGRRRAGGWRSVPSPPSRRSGAGGAAFLDGEEGARRSSFSTSPGDLGSRFWPVGRQRGPWVSERTEGSGPRLSSFPGGRGRPGRARRWPPSSRARGLVFGGGSRSLWSWASRLWAGTVPRSPSPGGACSSWVGTHCLGACGAGLRITSPARGVGKLYWEGRQR